MQRTGADQLQGLDYFRQQEEVYHGSLMSSWVPGFLNLQSSKHGSNWSRSTSYLGNKCDLFICAGSKAVASGDPVSALGYLQVNFLTDNSREAWQCMMARRKWATVDFVMEHSGFELFTYVCLADFLVSSGAAAKVRMRVKDLP